MYILKLYGVGSFCRTAKKLTPPALLSYKKNKNPKMKRI